MALNCAPYLQSCDYLALMLVPRDAHHAHKCFNLSKEWLYEFWSVAILHQQMEQPKLFL